MTAATISSMASKALNAESAMPVSEELRTWLDGSLALFFASHLQAATDEMVLSLAKAMGNHWQDPKYRFGYV